MTWLKETAACVTLGALLLSLRPLEAQAPAGDRPAEKLIIDLEDDQTYYTPVLKALPVANLQGATAYIQKDRTTGLPSAVLHKADGTKSILFTPAFGLFGYPSDYYVDGAANMPALNDQNDVAISASYTGPFVQGKPQDGGGIVLLSRAGGPPEIVLTTGGPASEIYPGFGELIMNNRRDFCFEVGLYSTGDRTIVKLVRALAPEYTPERVIGIAATLPGAPFSTGYWPKLDIDATGERHVNYIDDRGDVAFLSFPTVGVIPGTDGIKGVNGIWKLPASTQEFTKVAVAGEAAPGLANKTFKFIDHLHMNSAGQMVFVAQLSDSKLSVWFADPDGQLRPVAFDGQTVETNIGSLTIRGGANAKMISSTGAIPFVAGVSSEEDFDFVEAVILYQPNGTYAVIARNQNSAPGLPSGYFVDFRSPSANAENQVLFSASVSTLDHGLWLGAPDASPSLVAATGSRLRFEPAHKALPGLTELTLDGIYRQMMDSTSPWWGRWTQLGDGGHVVFAAEFKLPEERIRRAGLFRVSLSPAPIVVNSTGDARDNDLTDGVCDTGSTIVNRFGATVPECTLRAAIGEADAKPDRTTIAFSIPGESPFVIAVAERLPPIQHPVVIDGTTQAGVELDGNGDREGSRALELRGGNSEVRGLAIYRFDGTGIRLQGAGKNIVEQCTIGSNWAMDPGLGNGQHGIEVSQSAENTIGGAVGKGNVIVQNGFGGTSPYAGIAVEGGDSVGNVIRSNIVGNRLPTGERLGNRVGIQILLARATVVGGADGTGNILLDNATNGIYVFTPSGESMGTVIEGNQIAQTSGTGDPPIGTNGIYVELSVDTRIIRNVISGHKNHGIFITGRDDLSTPMRTRIVSNSITHAMVLSMRGEEKIPPNGGDGIHVFFSSENEIGGVELSEANWIAGNGGNGIVIGGAGSTGNRVLANSIGTDEFGYAYAPPEWARIPIDPSAGNGVVLEDGASANQIGGDLGVRATIGTISGNRRHGVVIRSPVDENGFPLGRVTQGNRVVNLKIGLDRGNEPLGNRGAGVLIENSASNEVRDNVIADNGTSGVTIRGREAKLNVLVSNKIGVDPEGSESRPNNFGGVIIPEGASETVIGRLDAGNTISSNLGPGVRIGSLLYSVGETPPEGNSVQANRIGVSLSGQQAMGNRGDGVVILYSPKNRVGGMRTGNPKTLSNTISGNDGHGVRVEGDMAVGTIIEGNLIGTSASGSGQIGNGGDGIHIERVRAECRFPTFIGGENVINKPKLGNIIAGNKRFGVSLEETIASCEGGSGVMVLGNQIGVDASGRRSKNDAGGIAIVNSSGNTIGSGNTVAENGGPGIVILGKSTGNAITQNSIYANAGIGIDLGGDGSDDNDGPAETACHDSDDGPNRRQNRCLLGPSADGTAIDGILNSACDREYRIEIFENPAGAFPSRRDGRKFIGEARIRTHPENGHAKFRIVGAKPGLVYTATVTDLSTRDTSEFSGRAEVGRSGPPEGGADFGDAPESYGTRFQSEGAYHLPGGELMLGSRVDFEPDGLTSSNALGDNETGDPLGDEDGVEFPALLRAGEIAAVVVSASADGFLEAWIDFGRDGSWDQPGDLILDGFPVTAGETTFEVPIPPAAVDGVSFARFRLSSLGGLGPRGPAPDGEVEDHAVRIQSDQVERSFRRGDTDGNGSLEITDAVALLGYLFLGGAEPRCPDASDADDNGAREITDAVVILGYLFLGGTEPAAPGPRVCGGDSTDDELGPCIGECEA